MVTAYLSRMISVLSVVTGVSSMTESVIQNAQKRVVALMDSIVALKKMENHAILAVKTLR